MRYESPTIIASVPASQLIALHNGGTGKGATTCHDGTRNTSNGAYEVDE